MTPNLKGSEDMEESVFGRPTASAPGWGAHATSAATASRGWQMPGWGHALSSSASSSAPSKFAFDAKTGWG